MSGPPYYVNWQKLETPHTVRLAGENKPWLEFKCAVTEATGYSCTLFVPELRGVWLIHKSGMTANVGGNDWRIYTLHPDDCAALCAVATGQPVTEGGK